MAAGFGAYDKAAQLAEQGNRIAKFALPTAATIFGGDVAIQSVRSINAAADDFIAGNEQEAARKLVSAGLDAVTAELIIKGLRNSDGNIIHNWTFSNSKHEPSPMVIYKKRINGDFYVVEAIPESKTKKLQIASVYKKKAVDESGRVLDANNTTSLDARSDSAQTLKVSELLSNPRHPEDVNSSQNPAERGADSIIRTLTSDARSDGGI